MKSPKLFDMVIVGGGPVGLFGAYYAGLRGMSCQILESLPVLGGRLVSVFPEKHVYDVPGFPKIRARDLARNLVEQALQFDAQVDVEQAVESLVAASDGRGWELHCRGGATHLGRTVLVAGGIGHFSPQRHSAPGAAQFEGRGLSYAVTAVDDFAGKHVVVAGGGDSAVDWATELQRVAGRVTLVHRTARFRAHERNLQTFREQGGEIITDTEIAEFGGSGDLAWVRLRHKSGSAQETVLHVGAALILFGYRSEYPDFSTWGFRVAEPDGEIVVNSGMDTGLPGVFAAGDVVWHEVKLKLMATGFAEAAIAVNRARRFLVPDEDLQPLHSTTLMEGR